MLRKAVVRCGVRDADVGSGLVELSATSMDESLQLKSMISTIAGMLVFFGCLC